MEIQCEFCGVFNDMSEMIVTRHSKLVCKDRNDCTTRQQLQNRVLVGFVTTNQSRRNMSQNPEAVEASYDPDYYHMKAKKLVTLDFNETFGSAEGQADANMFYVVWFAKVLGNWKALVSTDIISGQYWEVTYDGNKQQTYIDRYKKANNQAVTDEAYAALS